MRMLSLFTLCALICACAPADQVTALSERLAAAEARLETVEGRTDIVAQAVWDLTAETTGPAMVDFSSQNFGVGRGRYGAYLIAPVRIDEAGAGYRVRFNVINATSLTLTDARIRVSWPSDSGAKIITDSVAGNFAPGSARTVVLTLAEATPATLRAMNVQVEFAGARFAVAQ